VRAIRAPLDGNAHPRPKCFRGLTGRNSFSGSIVAKWIEERGPTFQRACDIYENADGGTPDSVSI